MSYPAGSLTGAVVALYELAKAELGDELNPYVFWTPSMALPALWHWILPGNVETPTTDPCRLVETARITATIAVEPSQDVAADAFALTEWADRYRDVCDLAFATDPSFAGAKRAKRRGLALVSDRLGEASVLSIEFPLELTLERRVQPPE